MYKTKKQDGEVAQNQTLTPIYILYFYYIIFFENRPIEIIGFKSCIRAGFLKVLITVFKSICYARTISARFAHDLTNLIFSARLYGF